MPNTNPDMLIFKVDADTQAITINGKNIELLEAAINSAMKQLDFSQVEGTVALATFCGMMMRAMDGDGEDTHHIELFIQHFTFCYQNIAGALDHTSAEAGLQ